MPGRSRSIEIDIQMRRIGSAWYRLKHHHPGTLEKIDAKLAEMGDTVGTCALCEDETFWESLPGGSVARCFYCGPIWLGGLGCIDLSECAGLEG